jgi:outer membrane protein OmpA-like peptidoglycan-associated protein
MKIYRTLPFASALLLAQAQTPMPPVPPLHSEGAAAGAIQGESSRQEEKNAQAAPGVPAIQGAPGGNGADMVKGTAQAINYRLLKSSTRIEFQGTGLLPAGKGVAKIKNKDGITLIKAKFENLPAPSAFGEANLTYVLWAISPEGQPTNLGELMVKKGKAKIKASEPLPSFGLLVTAEPYFAVTRPSDAVILQNAVGKDTGDKVELMDAKMDLMQQKQYSLELAAAAPLPADPKMPMEVQQARQAVRIAQGAGAAAYAAEPLDKAQQYLAQSEAGEGGKKGVVMTARSATQSAEEARSLAIQGKRVEAQAVAQRLAQAKLQQARDEAAQASAAQAQASAAQAQAQQQAQLSEQENAGLRSRLREELNGILETRASAKGLIVNMSGVLFKTGKATVLPTAREKLAKIAGILATHKGLKIEADGFTDSTGTGQFNARLSENRAQAVRDFLVSQGVPSEAIISRGFGEDHPIASNDTEAGRQENRRVELVVSGEGITGPRH